jgi:hypothetical protein
MAFFDTYSELTLQDQSRQGNVYQWHTQPWFDSYLQQDLSDSLSNAASCVTPVPSIPFGNSSSLVVLTQNPPGTAIDADRTCIAAVNFQLTFDLGGATSMGRSTDAAIMTAITWRPLVNEPLPCRMCAISKGPKALAKPHAVTIRP